MKYVTILFLVAFAGVSHAVEAQKYKIAKGYSVKFDGGGDVAGTFKDLSGTIVFNETDVSKSSVVLKINTASINTGNGMMNNHAKGKEWFDAKSFPAITFTSSSFKKTEKGFDVTGTMEIKGVKKEITIAFTFAKKSKGGEFKSKFQVDRTDYGVGKDGGTVGKTIKIDIVIPVAKA